MALTISTQASPIATKLVRQTSATATPNNDVLGGAGSIYFVQIDNTDNGTASYLKVYEDGNPTVGTTVPSYVFKVAAATTWSMVIPAGMAVSVLSFACVTTGGTGGTTAPTSPVEVIFACV